MSVSKRLKTATALVATMATHAGAFSLGDKIPSVNMHLGFPPAMVNMAERTAGKKTILVGMPGAFTPT
jgi:hypothetical protein